MADPAGHEEGAAGPVGGATKRLLDLAITIPALLLLTPLFLVVAAAVRLSSPGPILYRARRAGYRGSIFEIVKFRTMRVASGGGGPRITEADDARITLPGRFLRTTKLDELPQVFNILRGEMSIVGPRPEEADVLDLHYPAAVRREILRARPGLTGLLQILVFPDMTNEIIPEGMDPQEFYFRDQLPRRVAVDLDYVRNWSVAGDMMILLRTVHVVLVRAPRILLLGRHRVEHALPPVRDERLMDLFARHRKAGTTRECIH